MTLCTVSEAARQTGLNKSTISRYLKDHPDLNCGKEKPLLDLDEFKAHRAGNVNFAKSANYAGELFDESRMAPAQEESAPRERRSQAASPGVYAKAKGAHEALKARKVQLELDEKLGLVVSRAKVEDAAYELGQILQAALAGRNRQLAEELVNQDDPRTVRAALEDSDRRLLEKLANELDRSLNPISETEESRAA